MDTLTSKIVDSILILILFDREKFALCVVNTQITKVSGSDHRGEFRIGGRGKVKLHYNMGEVDM